MKIRLTATRWDQRTPKGIVRRLRGDQFTVKDDLAEWLIRSGAAEQVGRAPAATAPAPTEDDPGIEEDVIAELDADVAGVDDPESEPPEGEGDEPEVEDLAAERPAQSAPKADWVAYAVSQGIPAKEAEGMDRQKLIARTA